MYSMLIVLLNSIALIILLSTCTVKSADDTNVTEKVDKFLNQYNKDADRFLKEDALASWNYEINMNKANKNNKLEMSEKSSQFALNSSAAAKELLTLLGSEVPPNMNSSLRQLKLITRTATSKNSKDVIQLTTLVSKMTAIYSKTLIKKKINQSDFVFKLNSGLLPMMSNINKEYLGNLKWAWKIWREAVGPAIKPLYERFVSLANQGARENGFEDYGDFWRKEYEVENLEKMIEDILKEIHGLYKKLHAFTRYKLHGVLGSSVIDENGLIPAHLLGMWAQNWGHLYESMAPFPNKTIPDVTKTMQDKGWTPKKMLKTAESFFTSIGLEKMPESFYSKSVLAKDPGKQSVCHPSAWDFGQGDVRLKMPCLDTTQSNFITVHHEMGHIEYYLLYKDKPVKFRTGANPAFHEAVGDTIALSVMNPDHLASIGLLTESVGDEEEHINFLLKQALQKISFLPFSYIIDKWRWSVFAGKTSPEKYNDYWWKLREQYQGVKQPITREEDNLFDAGTFFHVAHNTEYLRYFLSHVLQFQFHETLCDLSGHRGPYHNCSIHNSKTAGAKLREMLTLGNEKPWPEVLETLTGSKLLTSKPILDYFKPLETWLDKHRDKNGYKLGW